MSDPCRLCLSVALVNNNIFGDDNKIYLKIVSCLPVKVSKEDTFPKKICDVCSGKVDDFYQFCHRVLEVENRFLLSHPKPDVSDLVVTKSNGHSNLESTEQVQFTSNFSRLNGLSVKKHVIDDTQNEDNKNSAKKTGFKCPVTVSTQTEVLLTEDDIKKEIGNKSPSNDDHYDDYSYSFDIDYVKNDVEKQDNPILELPKIKHKKKSKRNKGKLKKSKSKYSVLTNYESDTDDEVSLKNLKNKQKKKSSNAGQLGAYGLLDVNQIIGSGDISVDLDVVKEDFDAIKESWNCCVCFMKCFSREKLLSHYKSHYSSPDLCKDEIFDTCVMEEKIDDVVLFACPLCDKKFDSKVRHARHFAQHGVDKPYKCSLCEKTFKNPLEILKHGKKVHSFEEDGDTEDRGDGKPPQPATKRFICDTCDETFVYMKYLLAHRTARHPECKSRTLVNRCLHCRREFSHLNSLRRHLRSHSGERNFLCNVCGKSLTSREHLKFHIRIHTGFKPNICKTCGKGFVKKCNLTLHERVHSGERPHVCSHCGKAFSQRSTLVIHERYHSGSRPYTCKLCDKGFVAKGLLSMHMKTTCI